MKGVPRRGDIWTLDLNPVAGSEQQGRRPVFVVSPEAFNRSGLCWVCPITQGGRFDRFAGFAEPLSGTGLATQGVVQCSQIRALSWRERGAVHQEAAPEFVTEQVLMRVRAMLD